MTRETKEGRIELERQLEGALGRLWHALVQVDEVELREVPCAEARFMRGVGALRNELEKHELMAERARRACELAVEGVKEGRVPSHDEVRRALEGEFARRAGKLRAQERACVALVQQQEALDALPGDVLAQVAALHRQLVGRLHPFLRPDAGTADKSNLALARMAYRRADLSMLQSVESVTRDRVRDASWIGGLQRVEELYAELEIVRAKEAVVAQRLEGARARMPYRMRHLADDAAWERGKEGEMRERIAQCRELVALYQAYYRELMADAA